MESVYSTYEAKTKFSELLRKVRQGGRVVITFHEPARGNWKPIAPRPGALQRFLDDRD